MGAFLGVFFNMLIKDRNNQDTIIGVSNTSVPGMSVNSQSCYISVDANHIQISPTTLAPLLFAVRI